MSRQFTADEAVRKNVPLLVGLTAPSGGGKTWSALLLALGIQEVSGGDIYVIDSDNNRALHYAGMKTASGREIKFKHISFTAPHDSLSYREALRYCEAQKAGVIIVDTLSKEHDGEGGMLEWHDAELDRMAGTDYRKREAMSMLAWAKPKAARRKLIQTIQELDTHAIFTFRAKQGVKPVKVNGKTEVVQQGFTPIAGDEFVFEMTLNALLLPNSKGVATWDAEHVGERQMIKLPEQFAGLRTRTAPFDEKLGRHLADWALGGKKAEPRAKSVDLDQGQEPEPGPPQSATAAEPSAAQGDAASSAFDAGMDTAPGMQDTSGDTGQMTDGESEVDENAAAAQEQLSQSEEMALVEAEATIEEVSITAAEPSGSPEGPEVSIPVEFAAFADVVAAATTWEPIRDALPPLKKSASWRAADPEMHGRLHTMAFARLMDLVHEGYRFDFTDDLHAYRCYLSWEQEAGALKIHRDIVCKTKMWMNLQTDAKIVFDRAYSEAVTRIQGQSAPAAAEYS